jgi:xanthine dehydrogenase accessory factor
MDDEAIARAREWLDAGRRVALATVVDTWGSSPRPRGSQLAVRDDGLFVGSVSGGCVEGKVVEAALEVMASNTPRLLEFGVANEEAWEVGLACGGTVRIFVHVPDRATLAAIENAREIVVLTPLDGRPVTTGMPSDEALRAAAERAIATDQPETVDGVFVQAKNPPLSLVVVGAVHIAAPLTRIARELGYAVTVIDPRSGFARPERMPGVTVLAEWPDEAMPKLNIGHRTAVVALTHDPKIDDVALEAALKSDAFYIGALGSKKTHASRLARLAELGFGAEALARIHGPVGLAIGAKSPAEIAISIAAQMTSTLRVR